MDAEPGCDGAQGHPFSAEAADFCPFGGFLRGECFAALEPFRVREVTLPFLLTPAGGGAHFRLLAVSLVAVEAGRVVVHAGGLPGTHPPWPPHGTGSFVIAHDPAGLASDEGGFLAAAAGEPGALGEQERLLVRLKLAPVCGVNEPGGHSARVGGGVIPAAQSARTSPAPAPRS